MGSLTEIRANRVRVLKDLRKVQKAFDTEQEKFGRHLKRLLERKLKLPQMEDLERILEYVRVLDGMMDDMVRSVENTVKGFRF